MLKRLPRRAAFVLSVSAVALAGGVLPAEASTSTGWRAVATITIRGDDSGLTGVDAVSPRDAWAVGFAATSSGTKAVGLVEHWAGKSWRRVTLPAKVEKAWAGHGPTFEIVGASSATNVWAFNEFPVFSTSDAYIRLNGRSWTAGTLPGTNVALGHFVMLTSVEVLGKAGVWVFGGKLTGTGSSQPSLAPYVAHYNGKKWSTEAAPGSGEITAVSAISPRNMWAVVGVSGIGGSLGAASTPAVLHWNGARWQKAPLQPAGLPAGANLTAITAARGNALWIAGDVPTSSGGTAQDFTDQFSGANWGSPAALPGSAAPAAASGRMPYEVESMVPDGSGGLWALADNMSAAAPRLWHYAAGAWSGPARPSFRSPKRALLQLAAVPGSRGSVWAVGATGTSKRANGLIAITGPTPR